jgi:histidinol phosphatase-like enzyme (inositol monophosphatase family)
MNAKQALGFAQHWADITRPIALRYFRTSPEVTLKADKSPVTVADRKIESALRRLIHEQYPHHGIIGEEYECTPIKTYNWILDPIDGTKSFVMGNPLFGTLIGLLREDEPVAGLIDLPAMRERWTGDGHYTTFNDGANDCAAIVSNCNSIGQARLYVTPSCSAPTDERYRMDELIKQVSITLPVCDCYAYGLLASGHCDLIVEMGLEPYDYLPLVPVIEGAGGWLTDWKGNPLGLNSDGRVVAAGSRPLLDAALRVLASL